MRAWFSSFSWVLALLVVTICTTSLPGKTVVETDEEVKLLVPKVEQEELLYRSTDVQYSYLYQMMTETVRPSQYKTITAKVRQLTLGKGYWIDYQHEGVTGTGQRGNESRMAGYDGRITRVATRNAGTLNLTYAADPDVIQPHMLFNYAPKIKLSEFLSKGMSDTKLPPTLELKQVITRKGDERFVGVDCVVVESVETLGGTINGQKVAEQDKTRIWICPERNHLPLRCERIHMIKDKDGNTKERLASVAQISGLEGVTDTLVYPKGFFVIDFDLSPAAPDKKEERRRAWTIDRVRLNPAVAIQKLQDVKFRDGAVVSVVKDGQVITKFKQGNRPSELEADKAIEEVLGPGSSVIAKSETATTGPAAAPPPGIDVPIAQPAGSSRETRPNEIPSDAGTTAQPPAKP